MFSNALFRLVRGKAHQYRCDLRARGHFERHSEELRGGSSRDGARAGDFGGADKVSAAVAAKHVFAAFGQLHFAMPISSTAEF